MNIVIELRYRGIVDKPFEYLISGNRYIVQLIELWYRGIGGQALELSLLRIPSEIVQSLTAQSTKSSGLQIPKRVMGL